MSEGKSTDALRSNYWQNHELGGKYSAEYNWRTVPDQLYQGEFFRDSIHGRGTYKWEDGAVFEGSFYSNSKEGYATVSFRDNSCFEGLFIGNKPFGPGIYTYANGRQDAGFWLGRKLVRLSRAVDYVIPRLAPTSAAKIKLLQFRRLIRLDDARNSACDILEKYRGPSKHFPNPYSSFIYDPRSIFFEKEVFENAYFARSNPLPQEFYSALEVFEKEGEEEEENDDARERGHDDWQNPIALSHCQCSQELFQMKDTTARDEVDVCEKDSATQKDSQTGILYNMTRYGTVDRPPTTTTSEEDEEEKTEEDETSQKRSEVPKIVSWNRSELCTEMLKQIFRYRAFEDKLNFNLAKLMIGARTAFRSTGVREKESVHFLKMCSLGPRHVIKDLLCNYDISEELMDARGNNSLMFAAATDQLDVIDILLDYGTDVNAFNDEGLTPLNLCLLRRLAQANKISNWEAAFLPKEVDQAMVPEGYAQNEAWECRESIPSLDRVFGDGMSMNDSKTLIFDPNFLSPGNTSPSLPKDGSGRTTTRMNRTPDECRDNSSMSQITVLNILRSSRGARNNNSLDEDTQMPLSNCSQSVSNRSRPLGSNDPTPKLNVRMVPKTNKRQEFEQSVAKTGSDKYLFEFSFEKSPPAVTGVGSKKREGSAKSGKGKGKKEEPATEVVEPEPDPDLIEKLQEIDRTIEKLLERGADPNMSEVPKPSIHLAIYTKHLATVRLLLVYGASPDSQLHPNEGLLTPLHVLVLLKSCRESVEMCELLLSFGASTEEETRPEFFICEEEKSFLDAEQGRTPLQLLCMRPDAEHADPEDNLIKMALMLARSSNKEHFYGGHSCLTLAMHSGNLKLLKALLLSKFFGPNDVLGKDLGTALHVLVSTDFQKKTAYETSIKICDLLLEAGADPTREFKRPAKLLGTCVDYGYREIEIEKDVRKTSATGKKDTAKSDKTKKERGGERDHLKDHARVLEYLKEVIKKMKSGETDAVSKSRRNENVGKNVKKSAEDSRKMDSSKASGGRDAEAEKDKEKSSENADSKKRKGESAGTFDETKSRGKDSSKDPSTKPDKADRASKPDKTDDPGKPDKVNKPDKKTKKAEDPERVDKKAKTKGTEKDSEWKKGEKRNGKDKLKQDKGSKDPDKTAGKTDSNLLKAKPKPSTKSLSQKPCSETFPEKVRQNLLRLFGSCINLDVNELLLPYVVLRDGELYYRFQGKGSNQKEQYSLI